MKILKSLFFAGGFFFIFVCIGCTNNNLKYCFDSCYTEKITVNELINSSKVKERIIQDCSQEYYDSLISNSDIYSTLYYDSVQHSYYFYGWKDRMYNSDFNMQVRYYITNDSLAVTLMMFGFEVDKTGNSDYIDWLEAPSQHIETIKEYAESGNITAQTMLIMYFLSEGDYPQAAIWATESSERRHSTSAQFLMANIHFYGLGVTKDEAKAIKLFEKLAEQGNAQAQIIMGNLYANDTLVYQDYNKSLEWYLKAAEQSTYAQIVLGKTYWVDEFIAQDKIQAIQWFTKAAEAQDVEAQQILFYLYQEGEGIEQNYTEALKWLIKAAEAGDSGSQYYLAALYLKDEQVLHNISTEGVGELISQNIQKAKEWLTKAAEQGHNNAQIELGSCYYREKNTEDAIKWFTKSAKGGDAYAALRLRSIYKEIGDIEGVLEYSILNNYMLSR